MRSQKGGRSMERRREVLLRVGSRANPQPLIGLGTEWDPHIFRSWNCEEPGRPGFLAARDWPLFRERIRLLGLQRVRIQIQPEGYEPEAGRFDFREDNEAFAAILRQLETAQEYGIRVNATFWCAQRESWLGFADSPEWCSAPSDVEAYAENVVQFLREIRIRRGYTCLKEITLFNEPSWAYHGPGGPVDYPGFVRLFKWTDQRLREEGLRDGIVLVGADDAEHTAWYENCVRDTHAQADMFASHTYAYNLDTPCAVIREWLEGRVAFAREQGEGRPFLVDEFGTNFVIPPMTATDVHTYERGLFLAKFTALALEAGASGISYWCMYNQNYGPNNRMEVGLWGFSDENYAPRPTYFAWGILNTGLAAGSAVFPIETDGQEDVLAVAALSPQGRWSYLAVNTSGAPVQIRLQSPADPADNCEKRLYSPENVAGGDRLPPWTAAQAGTGGLTDVLPGRSFAVYRGSH